MQQVMCTGHQGNLHLAGHSGPPETFPQQGQGLIMPLMACISVAPIWGGKMMCLGDHKEQEIFSLTLGCQAQVQGPLMNHEILSIT